MHLFSEKYSTNLKYYSFLFEYTVKCNLFLWCKAEFSVLFLQSSVSHDPLQYQHLWLLLMLKTVVLLHICLVFLSGFFDKWKVQTFDRSNATADKTNQI